MMFLMTSIVELFAGGHLSNQHTLESFSSSFVVDGVY
jgi:hypothetical protein